MPPRKSSSTTRKPRTRKTTTPRKREQPDPRALDRETLQGVIDQAAPHEPKADDYEQLPLTEEERQAKVTAYTALKSVGLPIPSELSREVEDWIEVENQRREAERAVQAERQAAIEEENKKGPWYVRNGYTAPFSLRLDRQHENHARRIELKPRGTPGDMYPILEADLQDPLIQRNCNIGVIEIIPAGEARRIMDHQTKNMGQRQVHVPTAILRNSLGQTYPEDAVKTTVEFNQQGITVATLDPNQMQGAVEDKRVQVTRLQPGERSETREQFIPTGGNQAIVTQQPMSGPMSEMAKLKIADDLARRKGQGGIAAGLPPGVTVTVGEAQKVGS